jgi:polar amino acid transport system substrate-binding protein
MDGREDAYTFSVPYVNNSEVVITAENSGISSLADLEGKIVGVQADSAALTLLEEGGDQADLGATFGTLQQFADNNTAFAELMAGSLDAVALDIGVALYQINRREGYVILDEYLNAEKYAIGFKKGNDTLAEIVNKDLGILYENGTFMELAEKYEIADMVCLAETLGLGEAATEAETEAE